jgi:hypothetical protein
MDTTERRGWWWRDREKLEPVVAGQPARDSSPAVHIGECLRLRCSPSSIARAGQGKRSGATSSARAPDAGKGRRTRGLGRALHCGRWAGQAGPIESCCCCASSASSQVTALHAAGCIPPLCRLLQVTHITCSCCSLPQREAGRRAAVAEPASLGESAALRRPMPRHPFASPPERSTLGAPRLNA